MALKDNESAELVNEIIEEKFKPRGFTKQDVDKVISDLQIKVHSDFLTLTYDLVAPTEPPQE